MEEGGGRGTVHWPCLVREQKGNSYIWAPDFTLFLNVYQLYMSKLNLPLNASYNPANELLRREMGSYVCDVCKLRSWLGWQFEPPRFTILQTASKAGYEIISQDTTALHGLTLLLPVLTGGKSSVAWLTQSHHARKAACPHWVWHCPFQSLSEGGGGGHSYRLSCPSLFPSLSLKCPISTREMVQLVSSEATSNSRIPSIGVLRK